MIALITGDIVRSATVNTDEWMAELRRFLNTLGETPGDWEIFRGDSFQFQSKPEDAFSNFLLLKSIIKQVSGLDVRISIGLGEVEYRSPRITESNGSAFVHSGRTFDSMKDKQYLAFCTGHDSTDKTLNLLAQFASLIMDNWSRASAETIQAILEHPGRNQQQIAALLNINQSAVSQNRSRAQLDLLLELDNYYRSSINSFAE